MQGQFSISFRTGTYIPLTKLILVRVSYTYACHSSGIDLPARSTFVPDIVDVDTKLNSELLRCRLTRASGNY